MPLRRAATRMRTAWAVGVATLVGILTFTAVATAHTVQILAGPAGGYFQVHPETHTTAIILTKSFHVAGTPYQHIVNDSETGTIWGPWTRTGTGQYRVETCLWTTNYIVRTLHDNQGSGSALYESNLSGPCI